LRLDSYGPSGPERWSRSFSSRFAVEKFGRFLLLRSLAILSAIADGLRREAREIDRFVAGDLKPLETNAEATDSTSLSKPL